ncbi:hypothetical protein DF222_11085 [Corynebacterium yudongzhengii]|uniref:histidine kinase n=1 Tax=Corynebacterium yudongzhengii TaxID=2080740 RepID=A0A2U1T416_9CORY|nr:hypothetical protein DF222_11085 [Corynebacterium yudongzhengii]
MGVVKEQSLPGLLASMRISLHVLFAGLLLIGLATAATAGTAGVATWLLTPVLAAAYLAGTVFEHRMAGSHAYRRLQRLAPAWLGIVLAIWVALVFDAAQFIWLLFPLVFLILHVLPPVSGHLVVLAAWLVAVVLPPATGQWPVQVAAVLGPLIGTLAAVVGFRFYQLLRADAVEQRRIAETLRATRRELAVTENRAGRLAERERLAREIHDTLAQGLSSIVLLSRAAGRSLEAGQPDTARSQVAAIEDTAAENGADAGTGDRLGFLFRPLESGPGSVVSPRT